jgi:hypothetical protein
MRRYFLLAAGATIVARGALAQTAAENGTPIGVWRGTSLCLVKPSSCNDETVVYRITRLKAADSVSIDARKIVRGEEQEMGVLACSVAAATVVVTCRMPNGVWRFQVRRDSMLGELRLPDSTRFRDVRTRRER